jgi:hypothetical protein
VLTRNEVVDLLTAISAYDKRKPDNASILAWGKSAELGRWTFPEALDAVCEHFANSTEYLMPAHVTARVKATRQDRTMRAEALALEAAPVDPVAAARVTAAVEQLAKQMGWAERDTQRESFALRVRCPHCGVGEGVRCVSPKTGKALTQSACHPSRAEALADLLRGGAP